jgi:hypothetical protein
MARRQFLLEAAPFAVVLAVLAWQSGKAFHIDDANFLQVARGARADPLQAFRWAGGSNPPGHSLLLAALISLFGDSERALHLALIPFSLAAVAGMRWLSATFDLRPRWAAPLLLTCSGCFLLPATLLMPDVVMLAFLLPAVALLWSDETDPRAWKLAAAVVLFATGWTFRISGAPVLGLAAAAWILRRRWRAALPLLALLASFALWNLAGRAQLGSASSAATATMELHGSAGPLFLWRVLSTAAALVLFSAVPLAALLLTPGTGARRAVELVGFGAMAVAPFASYGSALVAVGAALLAAARLRRLPALQIDTLFLWLWAAAAFAVPAVYNQAAAKYVTLSLPPLIVLLLRGAPERASRTLAAAAVALAVAVPVAIADRHHADGLRDLIFNQVGAGLAEAKTVWVAGTPWGAAEYARRAGGRYLFSTLAPGTREAEWLSPGDEILDLSHPGSLALPPGSVALVAKGELTDDFPLRTMSDGAGLWSSQWGLLPFVWSRGPMQPWWRVRVLKPIR